ncbi:MAG: hypothetical protein N4A44_02915 [Alphaproteobacteria bacterium]|jgi:hypothetical protein|nr:hypothetical protein [Alphaproteobacteria bacterium]
MRVSRKIVSVMLVAELFVINSFAKHSFAARGRRVRTAGNQVATPASAEVVNPFAGNEVTTPSSNDSLSKLQEQLNATSEQLETSSQTVVDTDSGVVVQSESVVEGAEDVLVSPVDMESSEEFKQIKKTMQDICSAGSSAPMYLGCFNKYKFESAFLEAVEENDISESFDVVALEDEVAKMIKKRKVSLCADGGGKWKEDKDTCEYKVTYKRDGEIAEKWFTVGKRFMCGYETFGLGIKREKVDDTGHKMAVIMGSVQTGLAAINMASSIDLSGFKSGKKKKAEALEALGDDKGAFTSDSNLADIEKEVNRRRKVQAKADAKIDVLREDYKTDASFERAKRAAEKDYSSYSSEGEVYLDMDSFEGVATGVGGIVESSINQKEMERSADQIYGVCEFGNEIIPEENTVKIEWIY